MGWDQGQTTWFYFYLLEKIPPKNYLIRICNLWYTIRFNFRSYVISHLYAFHIYLVLLHPHHRSKFPWNLLIIKTCFKLSRHVKCWTVHFLKSVKPQTTSLSAPHCLVLFSPIKNYLERKTDTFTFRPGWSIHICFLRDQLLQLLSGIKNERYYLWITVNTFLTHTVKTTHCMQV